MTRAAQTVCLGGSRKKRSEKKGDFHCLTFFTAPTLTLGDQKREVVAKVVIDGFVIILLAAELKEVEHRIHIRTDIYLNHQSGNRTFENARFIIKPPSQIFVLIIEHLHTFLVSPPSMIYSRFLCCAISVICRSF
jgi:hypothetical protein